MTSFPSDFTFRTSTIPSPSPPARLESPCHTCHEGAALQNRRDNHGDVVGAFGHAYVAAEVPEDVLGDGFGGGAARLEGFDDAGTVEALVVEIHRVAEAVGVEQEDVALLEVDDELLVGFFGIDAEDQVVAGDLGDFSVAE